MMLGPQPKSQATRVLRALVENSHSTYQELAQATGLPAIAVAQGVARLKCNGYAMRVNTGGPINEVAIFAPTEAGIARLEGRDPEPEQIDTRTMVERAIAKRPLLVQCWGVAMEEPEVASA
jgi:DNA-binding Lrp family transcriptional regulator